VTLIEIRAIRKNVKINKKGPPSVALLEIQGNLI
jgi:hypothetical protein